MFFISLKLLTFPLYSWTEEESSTQTRGIQITVDTYLMEVINVSVEEIKERILKGAPVHFVEE